MNTTLNIFVCILFLPYPDHSAPHQKQRVVYMHSNAISMLLCVGCGAACTVTDKQLCLTSSGIEQQLMTSGRDMASESDVYGNMMLTLSDLQLREYCR